jgi:LEA14-like dessication related protein
MGEGMTTRAPLLAAAVALFAAAGCLRPLEKPTVKVDTVDVHSVTLRGMTGRMALDIFNPNQVSLPLKAVDWELSIGGARAVRGRVDLSASIPAMGTAPVAVQMHVDSMDAVQVAKRLAAGAREYRVEGTLIFDTQLGNLSVAFAGTGDLRQL